MADLSQYLNNGGGAPQSPVTASSAGSTPLAPSTQPMASSGSLPPLSSYMPNGGIPQSTVPQQTSGFNSQGLQNAISDIPGALSTIAHNIPGNQLLSDVGRSIGSTYQYAKGGIQKLLGNQQGAQQSFQKAQGIAAPINPTADFGSGANLGLTVAGALVPGGSTATTIGRTALLGGGLGAAQSVATGQSGTQTAINTGIGAAGGAVLGGAGELASKAGGAIRDLINPTEEAVNNARTNIASQYEKVLPLTPTQKATEANLLSKTGDNVYSTLAKYGVNLGSEEAPAHLQQVSDQFANATQYAKNNEHGYFNVNEIKANAFDQINKNIPSETARTTAKNTVQTEIDALIKANPKGVITDAEGNTKINSDLVERLRQTGNSLTNFNASDPQKIGQSTGYALSNAVRNQVDKEGTFAGYRTANAEWGKVIHAQEVLGKISDSGKSFKIPGGLAGSVTRRILSGAIGYHTAGVGGAILGEMGSEMGAKILSNPELRTYFDRQVISNFGDKNPTPEAVANLRQQIEDHLNQQASLKQLPAQTVTKAPLITPSPTTFEPQAQQINRQPIESPKLLPSRASPIQAPPAGTATNIERILQENRANNLGLNETKNAVVNRNTNLTMSQGLSRAKAEGRLPLKK